MTWQFTSITDRTSRPAPINPSWVRVGSPTAQARSLFASADGDFSATIWECTEGEFEWQYRSDEIIHILEGETYVDGRRLSVGDVAMFARGSTALWRITKPVRKLALHRSVPVPAWRAVASKAKAAVAAVIKR
jgi:uncharacterized protein